jgi:hypothetical protein
MSTVTYNVIFLIILTNWPCFLYKVVINLKRRVMPPRKRTRRGENVRQGNPAKRVGTIVRTGKADEGVSTEVENIGASFRRRTK